MRKLFLKSFFAAAALSFFFSSFARPEKDLELVEDKPRAIKNLKIKTLSDLQKLTPFESVSVIQKRYLPKTFRGEFNLSLSSVINNTFFYLGGAEVRAGFFLKEAHGFGAEGFVLFPPADKQVTKEMIGPPNNILPFTAVFPQFYGGVYYKWSPVFGKFAVLNNKIVYFDMYFSIGAGMSRIISGLGPDKQKILKEDIEAPVLAKEFFPSLRLSLGQVFALNKNWGFNWDLKWLYPFIQYKSSGSLQSSGGPHVPVNISLSLGFNYYFPGAGYR